MEEKRCDQIMASLGLASSPVMKEFKVLNLWKETSVAMCLLFLRKQSSLNPMQGRQQLRIMLLESSLPLCHTPSLQKTESLNTSSIFE